MPGLSASSPPKARRNQEEFRLACVVADYFDVALPPSVLWTHFPAGENRSEITGARLKRMGLQKGWPDYLVVHDGKLVGLELKTPTGAVSPEQRDVGAGLHRNGFHWHVVRSLDEVVAVLRLYCIPLKAHAA